MAFYISTFKYINNCFKTFNYKHVLETCLSDEKEFQDGFAGAMKFRNKTDWAREEGWGPLGVLSKEIALRTDSQRAPKK